MDPIQRPLAVTPFLLSFFPLFRHGANFSLYHDNPFLSFHLLNPPNLCEFIILNYRLSTSKTNILRKRRVSGLKGVGTSSSFVNCAIRYNAYRACNYYPIRIQALRISVLHVSLLIDNEYSLTEISNAWQIHRQGHATLLSVPVIIFYTSSELNMKILMKLTNHLWTNVRANS